MAGHPLEALYKVAVFTGMREGELLGLTWDRVDFKRGTIRIDRQLLRPRKKGDEFRFGPLKNDKPRTITPAPFVIETLKEHRKAQLAQKLYIGPLWEDGTDYVFRSETGSHLSYQVALTWFKKLQEKAGIQPRRFHDLRHTYAVAALRAGDSIKNVQEALGHHTAAFTMDTYAHVTEEMRKESAARMEAFISGLSK
jgi:integrase